jgi:hypothetical protein
MDNDTSPPATAKPIKPVKPDQRRKDAAGSGIKPLPPLDSIKPDTALRLYAAAALAFPDGSLTESSLRKAATDGDLVYEILRGKYFTTLADVEEWRAACRVEGRGRTSGSARKGETPTARSASARSGSSETDGGRSARARLQKIAKGLSGRSASTLPASTSPTAGANVIRLKSG